MTEIIRCDSTTNDSSFSESSEINEELIDTIDQILNSIIEENKLLKNYNKLINSKANNDFSSSNISSISIKDYLYRIIKYTEVEDNSLISSLIYIDQICLSSGIILSPYNIHRILFISILISIKYNEDKVYKNSSYARVAGISVKELNKLEREFLILIKYELFITKEKFEKYKNYLNEIKNEKFGKIPELI